MPFDAVTWNVVLLALAVAVVHTAAGPDHYVPFVMLARARKWSTRRTLWITAACGTGHVLSSILVGLIGVALGFAVANLETAEGVRGGFAAWALIAFGVAYALWGLRRAYRQRHDVAMHDHGDGHVHVHRHGGVPHSHGHRHPVEADATFWGLFLVFVLGPCEPLIPLLVLAASQGGWPLATAVAVAFGLATLVTMVTITLAARAGFERLRLGAAERWLHPVSGLVIAASGLAMVFGL